MSNKILIYVSFVEKIRNMNSRVHIPTLKYCYLKALYNKADIFIFKTIISKNLKKVSL